MQSLDNPTNCSDDRSQWLNEAVGRSTLVLLARTHLYGKRRQAELHGNCTLLNNRIAQYSKV